MDTSVWQIVWRTLVEDFSDLPDAAAVTRLVTRLSIAALLGGALGLEREWHGKDAGLRTHMLIAVGAALFVLIPLQSGMPTADLSRVLQGVIAGIGFLGGGAILKLSDERRIEGLTTAAGIWLTAAVGIAAGLGRETSAIAGTIFALIATAALARVSRRFSRAAENGPSEAS